MDDTINIVVDSTEVRAKLRSLVERMGNPAPALRVVGIQMVRGIQRNFDSQTAPDGTAWRSLAPSTLAGRRNRSEPGTRILIDSGRLRGSMTSKVESPTRVVAGTKVVYSAIQHFGGTAGRGHRSLIPARPYMGLKPEDVRLVVGVLERYLVRAEGGGGDA